MYRGKRVLDLFIVLVTAPLWVPVWAGVALLVRASLGRPVFFRQVRPGLGGAPFTLLKFRTMGHSAEGEGEPLPDERRLGAFGRWLRKTSLDEIPELINVLRGEMSLVGPRPLLPSYLPLYSARHRRRQDVLPGITGLAQISGRNALPWPERFELDVAYVETASLSLDLRILAQTAGAVLHAGGISAPGSATMPVFTGYSASEHRPERSEEPR